jgi:hypothetical protein
MKQISIKQFSKIVFFQSGKPLTCIKLFCIKYFQLYFISNFSGSFEKSVKGRIDNFDCTTAYYSL